MQTVGPIGEVEFSIEAAGNSGGGFGEELFFRFFEKRTIAQGLEKGEEFIDFLFTQTEVAHVVVIHGFGVVRLGPAGWLEIPHVVEFENLPEGWDGTIVHVGGG